MSDRAIFELLVVIGFITQMAGLVFLGSSCGSSGVIRKCQTFTKTSTGCALSSRLT